MSFAFVNQLPLSTVSQSSFIASRSQYRRPAIIPSCGSSNRVAYPSILMASSSEQHQSSTKSASTEEGSTPPLADIGLVGLAVMGQNLALNIADKGFNIAVHNRSASKVTDTVERARREELSDRLVGYEDMKDFVNGLSKPRKVIMLVKAGFPVDSTVSLLKDLLEEGDLIIDGGNEFYTNTDRRARLLEEHGILYMGMGVSGGEEGARFGPSLMPGGPKEAYDMICDMMRKVSAQVEDGPCVTYIGPGGSGNYVKMVHNGIEYGDMQLIGEAYDLLYNVAGLDKEDIAKVFEEWNAEELQSYLIEITAKILKQDDDVVDDGSLLVDKILDKAGSKGTGMWTVQEAASRGVPVPTMAAALEARYLSALKDDRMEASKALEGPDVSPVRGAYDRKQLTEDIRKALYASKICSYAQGMNLIRTAGIEGGWKLNLGAIARIWKGGCIIRAKFLDRIKLAYDRNPDLPSLLVDEEFASELADAQDSWRNVVSQAVQNGIAIPATTGSLAYYDGFRRGTLMSAQLVQAQRDFFGSHTYKRLDRPGTFHTRWSGDGVTIQQD